MKTIENDVYSTTLEQRKKSEIFATHSDKVRKKNNRVPGKCVREKSLLEDELWEGKDRDTCTRTMRY